MWHLIGSELIRFRKLAITFATVHLAILGAQSALGSLFIPASDFSSFGLLRFNLVFYAVFGLALGWLQLRAYERPTLWMFLIHRPLPPARIFTALAAAAVVLVLVVVALPLLSATLVLDHLSMRWVDLRHYGMTPFAFGTALSGYFAGCYLVLSRSRAALGALLLPMFFLTGLSVGWWSLVALLIVIGWLAYLACVYFEPDRTTPRGGFLPLALTALPLQYALFWCLAFVGLLLYTTRVAFVDAGWDWRGFANHSWDDYFDQGTFARATYLYDGAALAHGLQLAITPRTERLLEQIDRSAVLELAPYWWKAPSRHQPMFMDRQQSLEDPLHERRFVFSHDRRLFQGWNSRSLAAAGWLGVSGLVSNAQVTDEVPERLLDVPIVVDDQQLVTRQQIYVFDPQAMRFDLRFVVTGDERLVTPLIEHGTFASALSDRTLYLFTPSPAGDTGRFIQPAGGRLVPFAAVPLPGALRNLLKVLIAPVDRGFAVSFIVGTLSEREILPARQMVLEVSAGGAREVVVDEPLGTGPPAWSRHWGFVMSPLIRSLHDLVWTAIGPQRRYPVTLVDLLRHPPPRSIVGLAALVAALAAGLTAWLARRRLPPRRRWAWVLAAACCGMPGFLSMLLVMPRREAPATDRPPPRARLPPIADRDRAD